MSVEQVLAIGGPAGFRLVKQYDFLPVQHFFVLEPAPTRTGGRRTGAAIAASRALSPNSRPGAAPAHARRGRARLREVSAGHMLRVDFSVSVEERPTGPLPDPPARARWAAYGDLRRGKTRRERDAEEARERERSAKRVSDRMRKVETMRQTSSGSPVHSGRASVLVLSAVAAAILSFGERTAAQQGNGAMLDRLGAVKQNAAANQQALRKYSWVENMQIASEQQGRRGSRQIGVPVRRRRQAGLQTRPARRRRSSSSEASAAASRPRRRRTCRSTCSWSRA